MEKLTQYMLIIDLGILIVLSIDVWISYQNLQLQLAARRS